MSATVASRWRDVPEHRDGFARLTERLERCHYWQE